MESSAQVAALELLVAWSTEGNCSDAVQGDTLVGSIACEKDEMSSSQQGGSGRRAKSWPPSRPSRALNWADFVDSGVVGWRRSEDMGRVSDSGLSWGTPVRRVGASGECWHRRQPGQPDQVVGGGHQIAREVHPLQPAVARLTQAADRFHPAEDFLNGLFTNDKFCWSRPARLDLKWWHRAYRDR